MRVQVKQLDLNRGEAGDGSNCPVARAIRRALRKLGRYPADITVGADGEVTIFAGIEGEQQWNLPLPTKAVELVTAVDNEGGIFEENYAEPAPLTFTMQRPA